MLLTIREYGGKFTKPSKCQILAQKYTKFKLQRCLNKANSSGSFLNIITSRYGNRNYSRKKSEKCQTKT